jgi:hypothetical protein
VPRGWNETQVSIYASTATSISKIAALRRHPQATALAVADKSSIDRVQRHLRERLRAVNSMNSFGVRIG